MELMTRIEFRHVRIENLVRGDISYVLSLPYQGPHTISVLSYGVDERLSFKPCDAINSPALAIDKRPGPVCLSLLKPNEDAKSAAVNRTSQVLVLETIAIDGLSTGTVTAS